MNLLYSYLLHTEQIVQKATANEWMSQWSRNVNFSHGSSNSKGAAILFSTDLDFKIEKVIKDEKARYIIFDGGSILAMSLLLMCIREFVRI